MTDDAITMPATEVDGFERFPIERRPRGTACRLGDEAQALHRTRTGDPFLTMEVLYQLS